MRAKKRIPYTPIDNPDIEKVVCGSKEAYGITITDEWMEEMKNGDQQKREIWDKLMKDRMSTGYPYVVFANRSQ